MSSLSRIQAVPAFQDVLAVRTAADTIPAPPPSSKRALDEEAPPQSRLVESGRRNDTIPAPPPDDEEPAPSTERTLPDAS